MMEAFLASVQTKIKSEGEDVKSAILPLLKLIALTLFGLVPAHPKVHLVPKATFKLLSKLVFAVFLPCLIFTQLGPSISVKNIAQWWFIPVNVIIITAIGCILGCLVAFICQPPREFVRFTIIMTGIGNTGNILLAVVASVCHSSDAILSARIVMEMPPLEQYEIVDEEKEIELVPVDPNKPLLVERDC
ncbi:hypothetical protein OIU84_014551 [Salix udensis]|uniref:PIN-like protein n=1 Tax=Salix udensis TaxID=889485 RepID=A0AAD6NRI3_9ROSI|nr:hypothetical protein OIU84_014551 [Salix udensis]